jgi:hypothetical protein
MHDLDALKKDDAQVVYWHRELPPLDAEILDEHTIEATSCRVPGTIAHRDDLWRTCYESLMAQTRIRLEQEVIRLGGHYAHVFDEAIDIRRDEVKGEAWLRGRFSYVLYRRPSPRFLQSMLPCLIQEHLSRCWPALPA